jgi:purine-nucleoside phosphorylase
LINRLPSYLQLGRYNISAEDVVRGTLHCEPEAIQRKVIITPHWGSEVFAEAADSIEETAQGVWQLAYSHQFITLIRSGMGAPFAGDAILALGCTPCQVLVFIGSMAGLGHNHKIGDLCVVERSICGDGYSRYLNADIVPVDCFFQPAEPDIEFTRRIKNRTRLVCRPESVTLHQGTIISIDSILPEFFRLNHFVEELKCIGVEMETAAVFKAAKLVGIKAAALLVISDLPLIKKSLYSGRTQEEMEHYQVIKRSVLAKAILTSLINIRE